MQILKKISIFSKVSKNFDFSEIFEKFRFWSKFGIISKNFDFCQFSKNFDLSEIFEKISIFVKIFEDFEKFRF